VLCLPASSERALAKSVTIEADCVIFDLEDAVAPDEKQLARQRLTAHFQDHPAWHGERIIRINSLDTDHGEADLACVLACRPDAVLLPKVETPQHVRDLSQRLRKLDTARTIRIWAMMETPLAVIRAAQIAEAAHEAQWPLDCFVIGLNDLRKLTKVPRRQDRAFLIAWLMQIVLAARAFGLTVIDAVYNDFRDMAGFEDELGQAKAMGFDGKMLIHPAQIEPANRVFSPDKAEIIKARSIIAAFSDPSAAGLGVLNLDGEMIERLHLEQAEALIELADQMDRRQTSS
jgi:citrate lyase subunit beta/citryl-CoA lyase